MLKICHGCKCHIVNVCTQPASGTRYNHWKHDQKKVPEWSTFHKSTGPVSSSCWFTCCIHPFHPVMPHAQSQVFMQQLRWSPQSLSFPWGQKSWKCTKAVSFPCWHSIQHKVDKCNLMLKPISCCCKPMVANIFILELNYDRVEELLARPSLVHVFSITSSPLHLLIVLIKHSHVCTSSWVVLWHLEREN